MVENTHATAPASIVAEDKYKTISRRLIAYVIDYLLFVPLLILNNWVAQQVNDLFVAWVLTELQRWAPLVYRVVLHGVKGQTVGKMLTRVRVYDLSERPISMKQAILRDIVPIAMAFAGAVSLLVVVAPVLTSQAGSVSAPAWYSWWLQLSGPIYYAWLAAEIIVMLLNRKRRAIHDFVARSVVLKVDVQAEEPAAPGVRKATGSLVVMVALMAGVAALIMPAGFVTDGELCPGYKVDLAGYFGKLIPLTLVSAGLGAVLGRLIQKDRGSRSRGWAIVAVGVGIAACVVLNLFVAVFPGC